METDCYEQALQLAMKAERLAKENTVLANQVSVMEKRSAELSRRLRDAELRASEKADDLTCMAIAYMSGYHDAKKIMQQKKERMT